MRISRISIVSFEVMITVIRVVRPGFLGGGGRCVLPAPFLEVGWLLGDGRRLLGVISPLGLSLLPSYGYSCSLCRPSSLVVWQGHVVVVVVRLPHLRFSSRFYGDNSPVCTKPVVNISDCRDTVNGSFASRVLLDLPIVILIGLVGGRSSLHPLQQSPRQTQARGQQSRRQDSEGWAGSGVTGKA